MIASWLRISTTFCAGVTARSVVSLALALPALTLLAGAACKGQSDSAQSALPPAGERPRNVILVIADGLGPASVSFARQFQANEPLALDGVLRGTIRTNSADSLISDSAAGATAYGCGVKALNRSVGLDALERPCTTLADLAQKAGFATGVVTNTRLTHATPAAFSARHEDRNAEQDIAAQQIASERDLLLGGGRARFVPEAAGGKRDDGRDLLNEARERGYNVITERGDLLRAQALPLLGLFAESHIDYAIDRGPEQPGLLDLTRTALRLLSNDKRPFFLMLEAGRIDHAGHANDPATHLREIQEYDRVVAELIRFTNEDQRTLVVLVADHETGGLSLARDESPGAAYEWRPEALANIRASVEQMYLELVAQKEQQGDAFDREAAVLNLLRRHTNIRSLDEAELRWISEEPQFGNLGFVLGRIMSKRAGVAWGTWGHSAVDVNLYGFGPGVERFAGNLDNTEIGMRIAELMGWAPFPAVAEE